MSGNFVEDLLACFGSPGGETTDDTPPDGGTTSTTDTPDGPSPGGKTEDEPGETPTGSDTTTTDPEPGSTPPPPPPPPANGFLQINPLYGDAQFEEFFTIRRCSYDLLFKAPPRLRMACNVAVAKIQVEAVARIKAAIEKAVENMRAGLGTEAKPGKMSYSEAEKDILDPLNKTVQNEIDSILDEATKAFRAAGAGPELETDAVARFSKFKFLANIRFPGGGEPSANREKIKPLLAGLGQVLAEAKGLTTRSAMIGYFAGEFLAEWKEVQGWPTEQAPTPTTQGLSPSTPKPPPVAKELDEEQKASLRPKQDELLRLVEDYTAGLDRLEALHGQLEKVSKQIERINKKDGDAAIVEADKKAYGLVERSLKQFASGAQRLESALSDSAASCDTLRALIQLAFENDTPVRLEQMAKGLKGSDIEVQAQILETQAADLIKRIKED